MKVSMSGYDGEMTLEEIESLVSRQQGEYPYHDLEILTDADQGEIAVWLDDCDVEIHILDIIPTKADLELIDDHGICGHKPDAGCADCIGYPEYDWMLRRDMCSKCRECFKFQEE